MMKNAADEIEFLKQCYTSARNKYRPRHIRMLFIAEAPPGSLDRHFYFEDVKKQDSLFLEITGVLYPEQKAAYLRSGRDTAKKRALLERFREDGHWLLDLSEVPLELGERTLQDCIPHLLARLEKTVSKPTPIVLIKTSVFDTCFAVLQSLGYAVQNERMPFPGSGQQRVFREKFRKVVDTLG